MVGGQQGWRASDESPGFEMVPEADLPTDTMRMESRMAAVAGSNMAVLVGQRDTWTLGEQLGRGGTAIVYEAISAGGEPGVVKVLSTHRFPDTPEIRRRFEREATHLRQIDHPNVVKVLDIGEVSASKALVLERADLSLYDRLRVPDDPLPLARIIDYLTQALAGMQALHEYGLVHRDISPRNLLVFGADRLAVADLGAVRHYDDTTITGVGLGSLLYISNEQLRDPRHATPQDDIFSLGQIAYEVLAGLPPHGNPESLALACPDVPRRIVDAIERMRSYKREQRPKTAQEAAETLHIEGEVAVEVAIRSASRGQIEDAIKAMRRAYGQQLPDEQLVKDLAAIAASSEHRADVLAATTEWFELRATREMQVRHKAATEGATDDSDGDTGLGRMERLCEIARTGSSAGVDYLMHELEGGNLATTKLVDYALGKVDDPAGVSRIDHYLFSGTKRQRNYAALYFKRRGDRHRLHLAVAVNAVDHTQAFSQ